MKKSLLLISLWVSGFVSGFSQKDSSVHKIKDGGVYTAPSSSLHHAYKKKKSHSIKKNKVSRIPIATIHTSPNQNKIDSMNDAYQKLKNKN